MKYATQQEYLDSLPKKPAGAGALFFNTKGKVLILKTTYGKPEIPGGIINPMESPKAAAMREIKEELGLNVKLGRLLCIDYKNIGDDMDSYQIIFDGGILSEEQILAIKTCNEEIAEYCFVSQEIGISMLENSVGNRVKMALQAKAENTTYYLEHGKIS